MSFRLSDIYSFIGDLNLYDPFRINQVTPCYESVSNTLMSITRHFHMLLLLCSDIDLLCLTKPICM